MRDVRGVYDAIVLHCVFHSATRAIVIQYGNSAVPNFRRNFIENFLSYIMCCSFHIALLQVPTAQRHVSDEHRNKTQEKKINFYSEHLP